MVLVTGSKRVWFASMAISIVLFAIIYFTVIRPDQSTANHALKSGLAQSQQVINQAQKQLSTASSAANGAGAAAGSSAAVTSAVNQGQKILSKAQKLTKCVAAAGTDTGKLATCQSQYGG